MAEAEERAFELDEARELIEELQAGNLALTEPTQEAPK